MLRSLAALTYFLLILTCFADQLCFRGWIGCDQRYGAGGMQGMDRHHKVQLACCLLLPWRVFGLLVLSKVYASMLEHYQTDAAAVCELLSIAKMFIPKIIHSFNVQIIATSNESIRKSKQLKKSRKKRPSTASFGRNRRRILPQSSFSKTLSRRR